MNHIPTVSERARQFAQQNGRPATMQERWDFRAAELNEHRAKGGDPLPPSHGRALPPIR